MEGMWQTCSCLLDKRDGLLFVDWGVNISLYSPCTGDTHLFNLFPFEIIQFLLLKPASLSDISEYMALLCDEEDNAQWNNKIVNVLIQLKEFELIDYQKKTTV